MVFLFNFCRTVRKYIVKLHTQTKEIVIQSSKADHPRLGVFAAMTPAFTQRRYIRI